MSQTPLSPTAVLSARGTDLDGVVLDAERLDAYHVAREFYALA